MQSYRTGNSRTENTRQGGPFGVFFPLFVLV
jgi:hypothetical protein